MVKLNEIAIIDDDKITILLTKKRIQMCDLAENIVAFENGKSAYENFVERINNNQTLPDLILLDINMPLWDGWDFLQEFENNYKDKDLCLFMLTSSINPADKEKANNFRLIKDFLIKPIDENVLKDAVVKCKLKYTI